MSSEAIAGLRIVSIGGGTGLSTLLSGLKHFTGKDEFDVDSERPSWIETLTAVVTVTDDGGSSGRLREEFQILPPGDIRNCMVALAEDERLLTRLFQYRFESDGTLSGHSFGNLFLTALAGVTGDFLDAIRLSSEVLAIKGRIFPSTVENVDLVAELEDGRVIYGETRIVQSRARVRRLRLSCEDCKPLPETLDALKHADIITIGPGSLYTSIIPNLLVEGIVDAIRDSQALKIYICNIMTQPGETEDFTVEDHVRALYEYSHNLELDYVIVNSAPINDALREKYLADGAVQVEFKSGTHARLDGDTLIQAGSIAIPRSGFRLILGDLLNEDGVV
ncbi:MAG TPA: gluconeogenesis factor YvcK family protein, partial [Blastocatellia bacterium]|nr:gluconeogenesis factor YvcK family protein [Blastocatellia bacterium]